MIKSLFQKSLINSINENEEIVFSEAFPNSLSEQQLSDITSAIREVYGIGNYQKWPDHIKRLEKVKSILCMYNSCCIYNGKDSFYDKNYRKYDFKYDGRSYYQQYVDEFKELGGTKEELDKILENHLAHLNRSTIHRSVHTDSEGVIYHSLEDHDEIFHLFKNRVVKFNATCTATYSGELPLPSNIKTMDEVLNFIRENLSDASIIPGTVEWLNDLAPEDAVIMDDIKDIVDKDTGTSIYEEYDSEDIER